jgi:hypothetical protein
MSVTRSCFALHTHFPPQTPETRLHMCFPRHRSLRHPKDIIGYQIKETEARRSLAFDFSVLFVVPTTRPRVAADLLTYPPAVMCSRSRTTSTVPRALHCYFHPSLSPPATPIFTSPRTPLKGSTSPTRTGTLPSFWTPAPTFLHAVTNRYIHFPPRTLLRPGWKQIT